MRKQAKKSTSTRSANFSTKPRRGLKPGHYRLKAQHVKAILEGSVIADRKGDIFLVTAVITGGLTAKGRYFREIQLENGTTVTLIEGKQYRKPLARYCGGAVSPTWEAYLAARAARAERR